MKTLIAYVAIGSMALVACGGDGDSLSVNGAWARTSPMAADVGAGYMIIESPVDDELIGASVSSDIAERVEVHEVVMADEMSDEMSDEMAGEMSDEMSDEMSGEMGDDAHGGADAEMSGEMDDQMSGGMMMMREVDGVALPAGERVVFEPGGYHLMLIGLAAPLEVGTTFDIELEFATAAPMTVTFEVRDDAP